MWKTEGSVYLRVDYHPVLGDLVAETRFSHLACGRHMRDHA